jgi:hypothetical protein
MATLRAYVIVLLLGLAGQNTPAPPPLARASIEGVVVADETGQPLRKANILLQVFDPQNLRTRWTDLPAAVTDEFGRFVIEGLAEGSYRGIVEREGFAARKYGQESLLADGKTLKLAAGQQARMDFKLARAGVISGKVFEADGRPARDITLQAYVEEKTNARHALIPIAVTRTNDRGEYRIFGLPPGSYIVGVILRLGAVTGVYQSGSSNGFPNLLQAAGTLFPQQYYPGTFAPENAVAVNLAAGETPDIDIKLSPVKGVTIRGSIGIPFEQTPPGNVPLRMGVQSIAPSSFVAVQLVREQGPQLGRPQPTALGVARDGSFSIPAVYLPGPYKLIATGGTEPKNVSSQRFAAMTRIDVGTTDMDGITLDLKPAVRVSGRIAVDPSVAGSLQIRGLQAALVSVDDVVLADGNEVITTDDGYYRVRSQTALRVPIRDDGTFVFEGVLPIEYRVEIDGLPQGVLVRAAQFGTADALLPFAVDSGDSRELRITLGAAR